ncbi:unnamed protein product, partial [Discosporangium mesarthrocarpum]
MKESVEKGGEFSSVHYDNEETGLRLCLEECRGVLPEDVTMCCWDSSTTGVVGLCGADGSFTVLRGMDSGEKTSSSRYSVYFNTIPIFTRRDGRVGKVGSPPALPRRISQAWTQASFVPRGKGEVILVQGCSPRLLLTVLPDNNNNGSPNATSGTMSSPGNSGRHSFGLVDGSRVVALEGHKAQVKCLAVDFGGQLLVSGDQSGDLCVRLLPNPNTIPGPDLDPEGVQGVEGYGVKDEKGAVGITSPYPNLIHTLDKHVVLVGGANPGPLQAKHVSVPAGGVVRLWRAFQDRVKVNAGVSWSRHGSNVGPRLLLRVELIAEMLVGNFQQVSCLSASMRSSMMSSRTDGPSDDHGCDDDCHDTHHMMVFAGTLEGTVFGFDFNARLGLNPNPDPYDNHNPEEQKEQEGKVTLPLFQEDHRVGEESCRSATGLGHAVVKLQHTRRPIRCVSCSTTEEVAMAADEDGIVRIYRPSARSSELAQRLTSGSGLGLRLGSDLLGVGNLPCQHRQWDFLVECCIGSKPVACDFMTGEPGMGGKRRPGVRVRVREVLHACSRAAVLKVWSTSSLPVRPIPSTTPNPNPYTTLQTGPGLGTGSGSETGSGSGSETRSGSGSSLTRLPAGKRGKKRGGHRVDKKGLEEDNVQYVLGVEGFEGVEASFGGEGEVNSPRARGTAPGPSVQPQPSQKHPPRRVSFAASDQVNLRSTLRLGSGSGMHTPGQRQGAGEHDRNPSKSGNLLRVGGASVREVEVRGMRDMGASIRGSGRGGDESQSMPSKSPIPSAFQAPSLLYSALEHAALERRMKEEFDPHAAGEPEGLSRRASGAVNLDPLAKTFTDLVPISLDSPLPRPKRKGKQV